MSWRAKFYRHVIQGPVAPEQLEEFFAGEPDCQRIPAPADTPPGEGWTEFRFSAPNGEYAFVLFPPEAEAPPAVPDFPYEDANLLLVIQPLQERSVAEAAAARAERLGAELRLLALDLQQEGGTPVDPRAVVLVESYVRYGEEIALTIQAAARQKRRFLMVALILVALYGLVSILGLRR